MLYRNESDKAIELKYPRILTLWAKLAFHSAMSTIVLSGMLF